MVRGTKSDEDRIYQNDNGDLVIQDVQEKDGGVVSAILFTGENELVANSALKIVEEKLLSYVIVNKEKGETFLEAATICAGLGGSVAVPESEADNTAITKLVQNTKVWLGITRSATGEYVRSDNSTVLIQYTNWRGGAPAVTQGSSGVVLEADQTSEELGLWSVTAVTNTHATVCERVPRKLKSKRNSKKS